MGAEKVTMNIIVVGQVKSAKVIKSVAKATPSTIQLMPTLLASARRPNNVLASCDGVDGGPLCDRTTSCAHNITLRGNDWRGPVTSYVLYELGV
ncbi:hypothetical protein QTP88_027306 [Uroleucon formosanum]